MNHPHDNHDLRVLGLLRELFASATHDASAAMCRWTNGLIRVTLEDLLQVSLEDVAIELGIDDDLLTMVILTLPGPRGGNLVLVFDEPNGRKLAASLLDRPCDADGPWSAIEKSALTETGNILGCAYLNALTRLVGTDLIPSAPYFVQDYGASVLEQAVMAQALTSDHLLICRIGFHRADQKLGWHVVFVPTPGLRDAMEQSLHVAP